MRNHESKTPEENRAYLLQQALKRQTEAYDAQSDLSPQLDPLEQVTCRIGDTSCARAHASTLNRAAVGQPSRAGQSLLQLQRQYGNRYVQQVLRLARKGDGEAEATPEIEEAIRRARSGGQALDSRVQTQMESAFGADFSGVRVHTDAQANQAARSLNALAFTMDQEVFFSAGAYRPQSQAGKRLLAHELTHVAQQRGRADTPQVRYTVNEPGDRFEQEADHIAQAVVTGFPVHVGPKPTSAMVQRRDREGEPRVRFPTLEIFSALSGGALATSDTALTSREITIASSIFGSSINLSIVRIIETNIANAPTTLGNYIRVSPGYSMPDRILIHELAHVWQFQTRGTRYISDSVWHQTTAWLTRGSRGAAYDYTIVPGQSIDRYPAEHQACIVEDYFAYPYLRTDPEYQRLIAEVRAARPIPPSLRLEEAAGILGQPEIPLPTGELPGTEGGGVVPQIRIEF